MVEKVDKLKLLASFDNLAELTIFKNNLENRGILCYTENENSTYSLGSLLRGIELYVIIEDYDKAKKIMEEVRNK